MPRSRSAQSVPAVTAGAVKENEPPLVTITRVRSLFSIERSAAVPWPECRGRHDQNVRLPFDSHVGALGAGTHVAVSGRSPRRSSGFRPIASVLDGLSHVDHAALHLMATWERVQQRSGRAVVVDLSDAGPHAGQAEATR